MRKIFAAVFTLLSVAVFWLAPASAGAAPCTAPIGDGCGAYSWSGWPGSNGFNTYVMDQAVNVQPGSTGSVTANSPSSWATTASYTDCGGCVQTFNAVQQLTNNWGTGGFNGSSDMPLSALSKLQVVYTESDPAQPGNQYEFAPDLWTYYSSDIMMWADTSHVRCANNGLNSGNIIGQTKLGTTRNWTVYRYGGPGNEIVFVLDGGTSTDPVSTGTCAQQHSGTLHVLSALRWLANHGIGPAWADQHMTQLNTGWEITAGDGGTYSVTRLSYPVTVK